MHHARQLKARNNIIHNFQLFEQIINLLQLKVLTMTFVSRSLGNPATPSGPRMVNLPVTMPIAQIAAPNPNGGDQCNDSLTALTLALANFGLRLRTSGPITAIPRTALAWLSEVEKALQKAKDDCSGNPPALETINREAIEVQQHRNSLEFFAKRKETMEMALNPKTLAGLRKFVVDSLIRLKSLEKKPGNTQPNWEFPDLEPVRDFIYGMPAAARALFLRDGL